MRRRPPFTAFAIGVLALLVVTGVALRFLARRRTAHGTSPSRVASVPATAAPERESGAADRAATDRLGDDLEKPAHDGAHGDGADLDPLAGVGDPGRRGRPSTSTPIRAALPDNVYWKMSAPTKDPEVLRQREEERARWNVEYGKVLSNTATDEEIDAYYARRQQLARGLPRVHRLLARATTATDPDARRRAAEARGGDAARPARGDPAADRRGAAAPRRARGGAAGVARRPKGVRRRRARSAPDAIETVVASRLMRRRRHPDVRQHGTSTRAFGYIASRFSLIALARA